MPMDYLAIHFFVTYAETFLTYVNTCNKTAHWNFAYNTVQIFSVLIFCIFCIYEMKINACNACKITNCSLYLTYLI